MSLACNCCVVLMEAKIGTIDLHYVSVYTNCSPRRSTLAWSPSLCLSLGLARNSTDRFCWLNWSRLDEPTPAANLASFLSNLAAKLSILASHTMQPLCGLLAAGRSSWLEQQSLLPANKQTNQPTNQPAQTQRHAANGEHVLLTGEKYNGTAARSLFSARSSASLAWSAGAATAAAADHLEANHNGLWVCSTVHCGLFCLRERGPASLAGSLIGFVANRLNDTSLAGASSCASLPSSDFLSTSSGAPKIGRVRPIN